jgi:transcriptional regulator with XRE-family HTH domain
LTTPPEPIKRSPKAIIRVNGRMNICGIRVRERREELNLSQSELCARLASVTDAVWNPDRRDIHRIEYGTRKISDAEILALAISLETTAQFLLVGNSNEATAGGFRSPDWRL